MVLILHVDLVDHVDFVLHVGELKLVLEVYTGPMAFGSAGAPALPGSKVLLLKPPVIVIIIVTNLCCTFFTLL